MKKIMSENQQMASCNNDAQGDFYTAQRAQSNMDLFLGSKDQDELRDCVHPLSNKRSHFGKQEADNVSFYTAS
jgi:hypothetical protein